MITLTVYGAGLSYIGKMAGFDQLQHGMFFVGGSVALVFGLWLMKLLTFELPSAGVPAFVQRGAPWAVPFLTGVFLGNWGIGCPDPVFYVLMAYVASVGDLGQGALMSAVYAAGRSLPIVALAVLGLLGIYTLPALLKRRLGVERFFGWTLTAIAAFMLSDVLFGMWFDETWTHEAWNWALYQINANFGELRAADHFHFHGGPMTGFLFFVFVGFLVPGLGLYLKRLAGKGTPAAAVSISVALGLFFYLPPVIVVDLAERFGRELRAAPVRAPEAVLPDRSHGHGTQAHGGHDQGEHAGPHGHEPPPDPIVTTDTLDKLLHDPSVRVLDVRRPTDYRASHIPHAVNLPYDSVQDPDSRIQGKRLDDRRLAAMFGHAGIGARTRVVVYDDRDGNKGARIAWLLLYLGHDRVSVLDGGFARWLAERRPIDERVIEPPRAVFPVDVKPHLEATAAFVVERLGTPHTVVLDVRAPTAYATARAPRATSLPWRQNLTAGPAPVWKRPAELRAMYEAAGVTKDKTIVVQGDVADLSHHTVLTLRALGYPHVRSYDRSWSEWGPDSNLPKVDGQGQPLLVAGTTP
ncbi:MAG: hypothetical protein HY613_07900 [Candidatus Rokubacteria bacterium]|nr:hypothetical protein [Candidatus Rokubacteria bacterium]